MRDILDAVITPTWWFSVVVVGVLVNLLAALVKPRVESLLSHASSQWRKRSDAQAKRRHKRIVTLQENLTFQRYVQVRITRLDSFRNFLATTALFLLVLLGIYPQLPGTVGETQPDSIRVLLTGLAMFGMALSVAVQTVSNGLYIELTEALRVDSPSNCPAASDK